MSPVILVEGTFGGDWAKPRSRFSNMLRKHGLEPVLFEWSRNVDGLPGWLNWWQKGQHRSWISGGKALADKIRVMKLMNPGCRISVICHSHGVNVVIYAVLRAHDCGDPIQVDDLVSVCSPVREDMHKQANGARKYGIRRWRQIASQNGDFMQWAGEVFDGHLQLKGRTREWKQATSNILLEGIGHSKLLNDADRLRDAELWIAGFINTGAGVGVA